MGLSSNILWHQTNEEGFYEILKSKKLRYSYSQERIILKLKLEPIAFPMISVSDYPFAEIGNNKWAYGDFCIGFNQNWGNNVGFSPVYYVNPNSHILNLLDNLFDNVAECGSPKDLNIAMYLFSNLKYIEGPLKTKKKNFKKYRFYDEREWRSVLRLADAEKAEISPVLTEDDYKKYKENHNGKPLLDMGIDFEYDDINYIIVEKKEDVRKAREIVGNEIHIFTKNEIVEDVIGVDHHEEIKPSEEQMDIEAALRQINRVKSYIQERRGKGKQE